MARILTNDELDVIRDRLAKVCSTRLVANAGDMPDLLATIDSLKAELVKGRELLEEALVIVQGQRTQNRGWTIRAGSFVRSDR